MIGGGQNSFFGPVHRAAARLDDQYELVAGCFSTSGENNRTTGRELYLDDDRIYDNFRVMADREAAREDGIDVVAIVTPNHLHFAAARAFLDNGIHVICDKPMTTTVEEAEQLQDLVRRSGLVFALAHTCAGYPMVREAREMIMAGKIGTIRMVQVEYPQGWLAVSGEEERSKQASWRLDPDKAGLSACVGDIGTHAYHLAGYISGLEVEEISADLQSFGENRVLDDNAHIMLRFKGGARGMLWSSQIAIGHLNDLGIRIYGEAGSIFWQQETPDNLVLCRPGDKCETISKGNSGAARLPAGHPEGYFEALGQLYKDTALLVRNETADSQLVRALLPGVDDGLKGVRFIAAAVKSSQENACWVKP